MIQRLLLAMVFIGSHWLVMPSALAQAELTQTLTSQSGRLTLNYPDTWVGSNTIQADVQRILAGEALTVAENQATLDKVAIGPDIGGSHVVLAMLPTLEVYPLNPNPLDFTEVTDTLFGQGNPEVVTLDISGYPAARISVPAQKIIFMVVGLGPNVVAISAQADQDDDLPILIQIMESLQITIPQNRFEVENLTETLATEDGRLSFASGGGWYQGTRAAGSITSFSYISPLPSPIQDVMYQLTELGAMESVFFGVASRSYYDFARFFPPDWEPTPSDLEVVLDTTLTAIGIYSEADFSPLTVAGFPAVGVNLVMGENMGRAVVVDAEQSLYIAFSLYPVARQDDLLPLSEALFNSLSITPLSEELLALPPEGMGVGYRAPNFQTRLLTGEPIQLSDLRGQVVMLNFWFTTCPPCREEMPAMHRVYQDYQAKGFTVLGVNRADRPVDISAFLTEVGVDFPIALDTQARIQGQYAIVSYPTSLFIDRNGIIYDAYYEPLTAERITEIVEVGLGRE